MHNLQNQKSKVTRKIRTVADRHKEARSSREKKRENSAVSTQK
jgi:hypothetical protein